MARVPAAIVGTLVLTAFTTAGVGAHKPITSPYTYAADVGPILKNRCGACHAPGGVGPMSLLTHADAVPWGESMRGELLAGQMPPWRVERGGGRFRHAEGLSPRELNVLLTWLSGGTPPGDTARETEHTVAPRPWALGTPDDVLALPRVTLATDEQQREAEFTLGGADHDRALRAVDVLPGTASLLRSVTIHVTGSNGGRSGDEQLLSLWVPGDEPESLQAGAFHVPAGASITIRARYRKTWEFEGKQMSDESRVGLYFTDAAAPAVKVIAVVPASPVTLPRALRAVALYPDPALGDSDVAVTATRPDGRREELIAFRSRGGWARRYWLRDPLPLARGTRLSVRVTRDNPTLLPPGFVRPPAPAGPARVYINAIP